MRLKDGGRVVYTSNTHSSVIGAQRDTSEMVIVFQKGILSTVWRLRKNFD